MSSKLSRRSVVNGQAQERVSDAAPLSPQDNFPNVHTNAGIVGLGEPHRTGRG
jgi:hypothetical protein